MARRPNVLLHVVDDAQSYLWGAPFREACFAFVLCGCCPTAAALACACVRRRTAAACADARRSGRAQPRLPIRPRAPAHTRGALPRATRGDCSSSREVAPSPAERAQNSGRGAASGERAPPPACHRSPSPRHSSRSCPTTSTSTSAPGLSSRESTRVDFRAANGQFNPRKRPTAPNPQARGDSRRGSKVIPAASGFGRALSGRTRAPPLRSEAAAGNPGGTAVSALHIRRRRCRRFCDRLPLVLAPRTRIRVAAYGGHAPCISPHEHLERPRPLTPVRASFARALSPRE